MRCASSSCAETRRLSRTPKTKNSPLWARARDAGKKNTHTHLDPFEKKNPARSRYQDTGEFAGQPKAAAPVAVAAASVGAEVAPGAVAAVATAPAAPADAAEDAPKANASMYAQLRGRAASLLRRY